MQICFFDDQVGNQHFKPLTLTRPVDDLRLGILTIRQKWMKFLKTDHFSRLTDDHLAELFPSVPITSEQDCLWINSRAIPNLELVNQISNLSNGDTVSVHQTPAVILLDGKTSENLFTTKQTPVSEGQQFKAPGVVLTHLWDILELNAKEIESDLKFFDYKSLTETKAQQYFSSTPEQVFVSDSARIEPNCTFIADDGPIFIGDHVKIEAGALLRGPLAICSHSVIKMGARISNGTTIGPVCKAGGEISNSMLHSYSNKQHDGFMGNSIIGQWCNFGADTNTSNLKNNYRLVRLRNWDTSEYFEGGAQLLGTVMGDHSKTAINTMLNTGTMCGVSSNILTSKLTPGKIPSFTWLSNNGSLDYRFNKALETMKAMMKRRNVDLEISYEKMMKEVLNMEHTKQ